MPYPCLLAVSILAAAGVLIHELQCGAEQAGYSLKGSYAVATRDASNGLCLKTLHWLHVEFLIARLHAALHVVLVKRSAERLATLLATAWASLAAEL